MEYNFKCKKYNGIFARAFIHLFPKKDAIRVIKKIKNLLTSNGIAFIGTTKHIKSSEGYYLKRDYKPQLERYRKKWTEKELKDVITNEGFKVLFTGYHLEKNKNKHWVYFIIQKLEF